MNQIENQMNNVEDQLEEVQKIKSEIKLKYYKNCIKYSLLKLITPIQEIYYFPKL